MPIHDRFHRAITYLRVSVTDRCNLRCVYCMPEEGVQLRTHEEILRYEEIARIVRVGSELGLTKVRLTGGEPLVRPGIERLVAMIAQIPGLNDLAMTTNGILLERYARALAAAGLGRVNVSLDSLHPKRFHEITRWGTLDDVLSGLRAAEEAGLTPIKINTVVVRGLNDEEVPTLVAWAARRGYRLRFIEWMPVGHTVEDIAAWRSRFVSAREIRERIEAAYGPLEAGGARTTGPARCYRVQGMEVEIGFISPISERFCSQCNRLRLTADGQLRPCLLSDRELDLRTPLRQGIDDEGLKALLIEAVRMKPFGHHLDRDWRDAEERTMAEIGG